MRRFPSVRVLLAGLLVASTAPAGRAAASGIDGLAAADAAFRGRVEGLRCVRGEDGRIQTEASVAVRETFKGRLGARVLVVVPGGELDGEGEVVGCAPRLDPGAEYIILAGLRADGRLEPSGGAGGLERLAAPARGRRSAPDGGRLASLRAAAAAGALPGADLTAMEGGAWAALGGMSTNPIYGVASRYLACDRGVAIPYVVDLDALPTGITPVQALGAVSNAFAAWTAVTSLQFTNEGIVSLGIGADLVTTTDRRIRVQLHDLHNRIGGGTTLGIGGRSYRYDTNAFPAGGLGGRVGTNEFDETTRGHVILEHTNVTLQTLTTFEEVIGHEIGHALSLAHTSEDPVEADPALNGALMYYRVHADGRGATLSTTDVAHIRQAYPSDTPPWSFDRILDVVTGHPTQPSVTGVNEVRLAGYDLQAVAPTGVVVSVDTNNGTFTLTGDLLQFTPDGYYDAPRVSPSGGSYYDMAYVRFLETSNASPPYMVRILSLQADANGTSDGLPKGWMTNHFGHIAPLAGDLSRATDDRDGDGFTNLEEFLAGTDPTNATSALRVSALSSTGVTWSASPYHLYEVQASTDLVATAFVSVSAVQPTGTTGAAASSFTAPARFLRVRRVP